MKKLTTDIASVISTWMSTDEVREFVEQTRSASEDDTGRFKMVITTSDLDRYQEVISMDGWELEHYLKNPVVLWGHDHFTLPVGVTERLYKEDGKLIAEGRFAPHAHAQEIRKLYEAGIVRASSVGFLEKERQGNLITKAELIEWSFVSVPANPYALTLAMEKELNINELVTKGFMFVKKEAGEEEEAEAEAEPEVTPEQEDALAEKVANLVVAKLKTSVALEALDTEEPERTEVEPVADDEEAQKSLDKWNEDRRVIQKAATIIGDVLAEKRQEVQARLSK
jgi:HK97 family phage prohead protease